MSARIGFMQGRLSPLLGGRIQAFPWESWQDEFALAQRDGFRLMEWTLDQDRLYENPLLTRNGQAQIRLLCQRHELAVPSLTGDCFMQAPFWKVSGAVRARLQRDFRSICDGCAAVGISMIVVPLVDDGRLETADQQEVLESFLKSHTAFLNERHLRIVFECDLGPADMSTFIGRFDAATFGINYDIGNSASLGFDPAEEIAAYGLRVLNVHIKDRVRDGATVPLGTGNANFDRVFAGLARVAYTGNYILQTARAQDEGHAAVLVKYRDMTMNWLQTHGA
jgi:L-ribulose-5-phosphate 3-epimerase